MSLAQLTTGLIENTPVSGVRPTTNLVANISNNDTTMISVLIKGYYVSGATKTQYVEDLFSISAGNVLSLTYYAQFDALEFIFAPSSNAVDISTWGKNAAGELTAAQRALPAELNQI